MIGKEVKESKAVSISEVAEILEKNSKPEATYEQQVALDHAKKIIPKNAEALRKKLEGLNLMTENTIIKVLEIMPRNHMTLRQLLAREKRNYSDEEIAKILELTRAK